MALIQQIKRLGNKNPRVKRKMKKRQRASAETIKMLQMTPVKQVGTW